MNNIIFKRTILSTVVGSAFVASSFVTPVYAQSDESAIEEVVVTGSRIPQKTNLITASPVTEVDAEEFTYAGVVRVEDLLNDLPQTFSNNNSTDSNGAVGTASVDLRGLGRDRTLVLVNGKRLVRGSAGANGGGGDLNQIPDFLVKKVEVLTGGASAVYGSDAIGGVVNFIMRDDLDGILIDYQYSQYQHKNDNSAIQSIVTDNGFNLPSSSVSDGDISSFSFAFGSDIGDDQGHMTLYATYRNIEPILQGERDFSACALNSTNTACAGSSTLPIGRFTDFGTVSGARNATISNALVADIGQDAVDALTAEQLETESARIDAMLSANNASFAALSSFDLVTENNSSNFRDRTGDLYNFAPLNYYQRPDKRISLGGYGNFEINDYVETYAEVNYFRDETVSQIAPSGNFFVTEDIFCGNPLLSAQQFQEICGQYGLDNTQFFSDLETVAGLSSAPNFFIGRRNVEGGPRQNSLIHSSYRAVLGFKGDINENWSYDASINFAKGDLTNTYLNDLSITRITRSLDVVSDADGNPVCRSVVAGFDSNCVPWNLFTNNGNQLASDVTEGVTQAAIDYLTLPLFATGETTLRQFNAYVVGDLEQYGVQLPTANSGVSVSLGFENIEESLRFTPDNGYSTGDGAGQGGATTGVSGDLSVNEFFMETRVPLIDDMTAIKSLYLDAGFRSASYSTNQSAVSYKVALSWAVNEDIKARASFQDATRHANIRELFVPQSFGLFDGTDPCANGTDEDGNPTAPTASLEQCMRSGVTAAQYGNIASSPAGQYNQITGGNPNLRPEESDTFSFGFIYTPSYISGLSFTVDYFSIELNEAIDGIGSQTILDNCLSSGNALFCDLINRGSGGTLWITTDNIVNTNINTGFEERTGIDFNANYLLEVGDFGHINFNWVASALLTYDSQSISGGVIDDCKGKWGSTCGSPNPDFVSNLRATWVAPFDLTVSTKLRYISGVDSDDGSRPNFGSQTYVDLTASYNYKNYTARIGANNVFDRNPPIAGNPPTGNGNTYPGVYDALGRYVFIGLTAEF